MIKCLVCRKKINKVELDNPYMEYSIDLECGIKTLGSTNFKTYKHESFSQRTKKQHFNSASFLSNFSKLPNKGKPRLSKVASYNKESQQVNRTIKVERVLHELEIYTFNSYHQATSPDFLEKYIFTPIDSRYIRAYDVFITNTYTQDQKISLILYLLSLKFRHPEFLSLIRKMSLEEISLLNKRHTHPYTDEEQRQLGDLSNRILLKNTENQLYLDQLFESEIHFAKYDSFNCKIIENKTDIDFCISDNPTIYLTTSGKYIALDNSQNIQNWGFVIIPLSRKHLLVFSCLSQVPDNIENSNLIHQLNSLQYLQTKKWFIMSELIYPTVKEFQNNQLLNKHSSQDIAEVYSFLKQDLNDNFFDTWLKISKKINKTLSENIDPSEIDFNTPGYSKMKKNFIPVLKLYKKESSEQHILEAYDYIHQKDVCNIMTLDDLVVIESEICVVKHNY